MDMKIDFDPYLKEDLEQIVNSNVPFEAMRNKSILITGATGLIGFSLVRTFFYANQRLKLNTRIIAVVRNIDKAKWLYGEMFNQECISFLISDVIQPITFDAELHYVIHCASITNSKMMITKPVETIESSVLGANNILKLCVKTGINSAVYLSSMEAYGVFEEEKYVDEEMMGYINPLKVRSNYPESKRLCENLCVAYYSEFQVPVKIARLAQTFGAGIPSGENRVFSQFAKSVIENKDIVLHTKGKSEGNYCYLSDAITGILLILFCGENGQAYNVSNEENHSTISDMAHMVADNFGNGNIKVVFDIPTENKYGYANDVKMKLNSSKLRSLGWIPRVDLVESYRRMINSMKHMSNLEE